MNEAQLRSLPKVLLHDHLDGGPRVETVVELAEESGYTALPTSDPAELAEWFHQGESGSLERYLDAFVHTTGVMQTADALERVAHEAVLDLAAENVVYAELRFAPSLHLAGGLDRRSAIEAVLMGLKRASLDTGMVTGLIVVALRQSTDSELVAGAATDFAGEGVVGFDLAGPEAGYPADHHIAACRLARESGLALTLHAGEGDGPNSIWQAVGRCGADRVGHGVRIVEDCKVVHGEIQELGAVARMLRDLRVPLEVSITSNLHTAAFPSPRAHPFGALYRAGFAVTLNTDNRLMSGIDLTHEMALAMEAYDLDRGDLLELTTNAIRAGFGDWPTRRRLLEDVIQPAYRG